MKEIPLGKGLFALVDDCDYEYLKRFRWFPKTIKGRTFAVRYRNVIDGPKRKREVVFMHREIMRAERGDRVYHKNGNTLDNRWQNLSCYLRRGTYSSNPDVECILRRFFIGLDGF